MQLASGAVQASSRGSLDVVAGRYLLREKLGEGGMGVVYRAEDQSTGRGVALKQLLSRELGDKRSAIEALFEREYHTLARLKHPSIIEVYDYGLTQTGPYYTMEILSGQDLRELSPLPFLDVCRHLRDIASSLALLHTHRLVHRDLSPRNVRLTADGTAKLLDFGALTSFGRPETIVGTPPFVAPELLRQMPIDQRADLFAFGALAYWALTGHNAFPARRLNELAALWIHPPASPSSFGHEVPRALEDLVMSLLSIDPLGRPATAAEVIDRLGAIGGLPALPPARTVESYLLSGKLVGRQQELDWMNQRLDRLAEGRGTLGVLEGAPGVGKTRLLDELSLEALLKGVRVLRADARTSGGAFGTAAVLAQAALAICPEAALHTAAPHAAQLGHLSQAVRAALGAENLAPHCEDVAEERARMQSALHDWFMAMAKQQRLMLAVDNVELADPGTGAFLAALGAEARASGLIVIATHGSMPDGKVDGALRALRGQAARMRLSNLSSAACEEFCISLFGNVANVGRLARLLHDKSGGNPQLCMELAQLLVKRQIAKYVGGTWVLPQQLNEDELPSQMEQVIGERLAALGDAARELAEALCIFERAVSLSEMVAMLAPRDERYVFSALDELIAENVLVSDGALHRFAHESLRRAIYTLLDVDARKAQHLRAAQAALANQRLTAVQRIEAGSHLLRAGQEGRGAEVMVQALYAYKQEGDFESSPEQILRASHTALQIYERQGRSEEERVELMTLLVGLSFLSDWRLNLQYAERTLEVGFRVAGLELARKLHGFLPQKLALGIALLLTFVRLKYLQLRGRIGYDLPRAIEMLCAIIPPAVATLNICYDIAAVKRMVDRLEPLSYFGKQHIACLMRDFAVAQLRMGQSRELDARQELLYMEQRYCNPKIVKLLGKELWSALYGGVLFSQGVLDPFWFGDRALETARRLERIDFKIWRMAADQVRLLFHALRGESEQVQRYSERVELFAMQGGTTWQAEMFWPVLLLSGAVLNGDTIGVRRLWEQLRRRGKDAPGLRSYARAARACYAALRGEHAKAIRLFMRVLPEIPPRERVAWHTLRGVFAGILNDVGQHARAKEILVDVLSHVRPGEEEVVGRHLELVRQLALAEAGLGRLERAAQLLDELLAKHGSRDQPLLLGLLHKARAEVALLGRDSGAFELHLAKMEQHFRATRNPALVAQWETLADRGKRKKIRVKHPGAGDADRSSEVMIDELATKAASAGEAHAYIVSMLASWARAEEAHLYAWSGADLRLVSSTGSGQPPSDVETLLHGAALGSLSETSDRTQTVNGTGSESSLADSGLLSADGQSLPSALVNSVALPPEANYQAFVLSHWDGERFVLVGALAVKTLPDNLYRLDVRSLAAAAAAMYARRDVAPTAIRRMT